MDGMRESDSGVSIRLCVCACDCASNNDKLPIMLPIDALVESVLDWQLEPTTFDARLELEREGKVRSLTVQACVWKSKREERDESSFLLLLDVSNQSNLVFPTC